MQKRIKNFVVNLLAGIIVFLLVLVIFAFNNASSVNSKNSSDVASSSFEGPTSAPANIEGPDGPPPTSP